MSTPAPDPRTACEIVVLRRIREALDEAYRQQQIHHKDMEEFTYWQGKVHGLKDMLDVEKMMGSDRVPLGALFNHGFLSRFLEANCGHHSIAASSFSLGCLFRSAVSRNPRNLYSAFYYLSHSSLCALSKVCRGSLRQKYK